MGSAKNPITIDEDEGFSDTMTPQNFHPQQTPAMEPQPALRSIENLQNFWLLYSFLIKYFCKNCCLLFTLFFVIN